MTIYYVYVYIDPRNNMPFYIGAGHGKRDVSHLTACHKGKGFNPHFYNKLRKLHREGSTPIVWRIADGLSRERAFGVWEPWFIKAIGRKDLGTGPLCNMTAGGEGASNLSPETKARHSTAIKEAHSRPEVKARYSASLKESHNRPEVKERISAFQKEYQSRPEVKARKSVVMKVAQNRPETKTRKSAAVKEAWSQPGVKARQWAAAVKEAWSRPEAKARQLAAIREAWSRPEVKAHHAVGQRNRPPTKGYRGATQRGSRWRASIRVNRRAKNLGTFATKLEALKAYNNGLDLYCGGDGWKNRVAERRTTSLPVATERRSAERRVAV